MEAPIKMTKNLLALRLQLVLVQPLRKLTKNNLNFQNWQSKTAELLAGIFGGSSDLASQFSNISYHPKAGKGEAPSPKDKYLAGLEEGERILKLAIERITGEDYQGIEVNITAPNINQVINGALEISTLDNEQKVKIHGEVMAILKQLREQKELLDKGDEDFFNNRIVCLLNKVSLRI